MPQEMNLEGKTVLVTGSTDGVGLLVARQLADQGAHVLIHGRNIQRGQQVVEQIRNGGRGSAVFLPADLSSLAEVRRLADAVRQDCDLSTMPVSARGARTQSEKSVKTATNCASPSIISPDFCSQNCCSLSS